MEVHQAGVPVRMRAPVSSQNVTSGSSREAESAQLATALSVEKRKEEERFAALRLQWRPQGSFDYRIVGDDEERVHGMRNTTGPQYLGGVSNAFDVPSARVRQGLGSQNSSESFVVPVRDQTYTNATQVQQSTAMHAFAHRVAESAAQRTTDRRPQASSFVVGSGGLDLSREKVQSLTLAKRDAQEVAARFGTSGLPAAVRSDPPAKQLILVVHAEPASVGTNRRFAVSDGVSDRGKRQATCTGKYLARWLRAAGQAARERVTSFVSAPGDVATQTAFHVFSAMLAADTEDGAHNRSVDARLEQRLDPRLADVTSVDEFRSFPTGSEAVAEAIEALVNPFSTEGPNQTAVELYVVYPTVARLCLSRALQLAPSAQACFELAHGSISIINVAATGSCRVLCCGSTSHQEPSDAS